MHWFFLLWLFFYDAVSAEVTDNHQTEVTFPEPLKEDGFNKRTGLHLVEFYSPYCGHCTKLAPIWKDTWASFYEEGQKLNIALSQVNCVESGDLCSKEKIAAYPTIRLYGPGGFIQSFPGNLARSKENLIEFARQAANDPSNLEFENVKSLSEYISASKFAKLLSGEAKLPYLVSFWPAKNSRSTSDDDIVYENCDECDLFQRTWKVLSVKLAAFNISTGHLNCESSPTLCRKLGFSDLVEIVNHRADRFPRVALVLPGKKTNNLFVYDGPLSTSVSVYEDFAKRTFANSNIPEISAKNITKIVEKNFKVYQSIEGVPPPQKIHVVFSYNPDTVTPEDLNFLQNLIEPISSIPNAYLYKTKESLASTVETIYGYMYKLINYDDTVPKKTPKPECMDLNIMPENPNVFVFRDGERIPHIFSGFSTTELRNLDFLMSWIRKFSLPLVNEVTPNNFEQLLNFEPNTYQGLAIELVDSTNRRTTDKSNNYLGKLLVGGYDYEHVRMESMIDGILAKRKLKLEKAKSLKEKGAKTDAILEAARKEIIHEDNKKVIFGYLDISKYVSILSQMNFEKPLGEDDIGRVILIDKTTRFYYTTDPSGNTLIAEPYNIRETFLNVLLHQKSSFSKRIRGRLLNSPFKHSLRIFDNIHQYGFWGYLGTFSSAFVIFKSIRVYKRRSLDRRYKAKRNVIGILGKSEKRRSKD